MRHLWRWARTSNDRAVENARGAAIACSRRRLERAEVERDLATRSAPGTGVAPGSQHPA